MKTAILDSFLKFYVMGSPGIDLFGISHVKVDLIPVLKMFVLQIALGTTHNIKFQKTV